MKNLFEPSRAEKIKDRLDMLKADSQPLWGTMSSAQMMAHCSGALKMAFGEILPERTFFGSIMGFIIKPLVLGNDNPMRPNSPTIQTLLIQDERNFETEQTELKRLIDRFTKAGPDDITTLPHSFFGKLTRQEWAILMYKHLDHHLRQFEV